jgi:hypothetical protein
MVVVLIDHMVKMEDIQLKIKMCRLSEHSEFSSIVPVSLARKTKSHLL